MKRILLFLLLATTTFGQEPGKPALELVNPDVEAKAEPQNSGLPVLGNLTATEREEILKALTDSKASKVPDIFEEFEEDELKPFPPESVYPILIQDLQTMAPDRALTTRYLSLYAIPPDERKNHIIISSFVLNSLSWSHKITWPEVVPGTNNGLIRFNILDYARGLKVQEDIGRWVETWELMTTGDVYFMEPWVTKEDAVLAQQLSGSIGCVVRADWFNFYAMLDDDPNTKDAVEGFYSLFLGLPDTEAELFKILSINQTTIAHKGVDRAGVVVISGEESDAPKVARNNRKVNRYPTIETPYGGYFYFTQDVINSQGARNFINDPLSNYKDGGEYIWRLPNGLQAYYLTQRFVVNGKEVFKRIAEVPIGVAVDPHFEDGRVKIRSCAHCHQKGINKFKDSMQVLLATQPPGGVVKPVVKRLEDLLRVEQLYYPDFPVYLAADQLNYQQSVFLATGLTSAEFVATYKACLDFYEAPVTPSRAVWEFGIHDQNLENYLADKVVSTTKGSLLLFVKGGNIQRDTFEEEFKNGKLLQNIKQNIINKGQQPQLNLVVPSVVTGTANTSKLEITERVDQVTLNVASGMYESGGTEVIATIPANTTLKILRTSSNAAGTQYIYVEYEGQKGWIKLEQ